MDEYSTYSIYMYFAKGTLCDVKSIYSFRYVIHSAVRFLKIIESSLRVNVCILCITCLVTQLAAMYADLWS